MVVRCPECHGQLHAGSNPENDWSCEDCDWKGPYPKPSKEQLQRLGYLMKNSN